MVGDPSCGKSQMLRFVMNTAPLAISTTGRGSSGVGLTAAMTREVGSRDFTIEAGAMVLADRGVICIDEFDKMGQNDRVAIHEAMEQQCVTISKAGMHVQLNARCSVTAAANPIYGTLDPKLDLAKNIGLPDSLLSRFVLVFVVRDLADEFIDKKIATQVLSQCQRKADDSIRRRGVEQIHSSILERRQQADTVRSNEPTEVFEKSGDPGEGRPEVLTVDFLRKYVKYCKRFTPVLNQAAQDMVAEKYVDMRRKFQSGFADTRDPNAEQKPRLAVTTRSLEALIRLSTAHAKMKLRKEEVLAEDVEEAWKLMMMAREEEVGTPEADEALVHDLGDQGPGDDAAGGKRKRADGADGASPAAKAARSSTSGISTARYKILETNVGRTFAEFEVSMGLTEIDRAELLESVNAKLAPTEEPFGAGEFDAGIARLEVVNKVYVGETGTISQIS
jgi:DNA replication licensing factor MCM3